MLPSVQVGSFSAEKLKSLVKANPINYVNTTRYTYGTAGFRMNSDYLNSVVVRVGILAVLRSLSSECVEYVVCKRTNRMIKVHKGVGVMITASHNPGSDNGVKVIDMNGGMLDRAWESDAELLANIGEDSMLELFEDIMQRKQLSQSTPALVFIGHDTRTSSPLLASLVEQICLYAGAVVMQYDYCTTPQQHFHVGFSNRHCVVTTKEDYHKVLISPYIEYFTEYIQIKKQERKADVYVDCANGIGGLAVLEAEQYFPQLSMLPTVLHLENSPFLPKCTEAKVTIHLYGEYMVGLNKKMEVNKDCGAEVVKNRKWPSNFPKSLDANLDNITYASFDGDCDRLVLFLQDTELSLIDGDRIGVFILTCLHQLQSKCKLQARIGYVGTQYTNGAAVRYARDQGVDVELALTGVKHLHAKAELYDVGVYFESNGHGTVQFQKEFLQRLAEQSDDADAQLARCKMQLLSQIINPFIGDAFSDQMLLLTLFAEFDFSPRKMLQQYDDSPCTLTKVQITDCSLVKTETHNEAICVSPSGLQDAISACVAIYGSEARAFVRPSGTEPIVRVYAEAATRQEAEELNSKIQAQVTQYTATEE